MKNPFLELQILSNRLWDIDKCIRYNACNKKRAVKEIEKILIEIKAIDFDTEIKVIKELYN